MIFNWGRKMKSGLKVSCVYLVAGLRQLSPGSQPRPMKGLPKNVFLEAKGVLPMLLTQLLLLLLSRPAPTTPKPHTEDRHFFLFALNIAPPTPNISKEVLI